MGSRSVRLTIFGLLGALVGLGLGYWLLRPAGKAVLPTPSESSEEDTSSVPISSQTLTGKVLPLGPSIYTQGTHKLVDQQGEITAVLQADDDKLQLAEGYRVEVTGKISKTVEGDMKLMRVEEIKFK